MLCWKVENRIGCGTRGVAEIMEHPWLNSVDWEKVRSKSLRPPYVPKESNEKTQMVDLNVFEKNKKFRKRNSDSGQVNSSVQRKFKGFEHNIEVTRKIVNNSVSRGMTFSKTEKRLLKVDLKRVFKNSMRPQNNFK